MAITDPEAIKFCNEYVRRECRKIVEQLYRLNAMTARWNAIGGTAMFPNDAGEDVEDGREDITTLTGADVNNIMARVAQLNAVLDADYAMDVIFKGYVGPLEV